MFIWIRSTTCKFDLKKHFIPIIIIMVAHLLIGTVGTKDGLAGPNQQKLEIKSSNKICRFQLQTNLNPLQFICKSPLGFQTDLNPIETSLHTAAIT